VTILGLTLLHFTEMIITSSLLHQMNVCIVTSRRTVYLMIISHMLPSGWQRALLPKLVDDCKCLLPKPTWFTASYRVYTPRFETCVSSDFITPYTMLYCYYFSIFKN